MNIKTLLAGKELKAMIATPPGRVQSYLQSPEKKLLPYSCKLHIYKNDLAEILIRTSKDLRWGAGVKVVLDYYYDSLVNDDFEWRFTLGDNPDVNKITPYQSQFLLTDDFIPDAKILVGDFMERSLDDLSAIASIEESWGIFYNACRSGRKILLDLSLLRPSGTKNSVGLESTGAVGDGTNSENNSCFLGIYEHIAKFARKGDIGSLLQLLGTLNSTLRRGGLYKNGIVTSSMRYDNPHFEDYLKFPIGEIAGSHKKAARVNSDVLLNPDLVDLIVEKVASESLFLEKFEDGVDDHLFWNVCEGLKIPDKGTCLIWRVNLGLCETFVDIVQAYKDAAYYLTHLHHQWRSDNPERAIYSAPQEEDLQIGLDPMGLANFLAINNITYFEFNEALEAFLDNETETFEILLDSGSLAASLVDTLYLAMNEAVKVSDSICEGYGYPKLERIFTVEPSQSHSFETKDSKGFTTCRAIFPPSTRKEERVSSTMKTRIYNHGKVQTISDVGGELLERVCANFQALMDLTGRSHGISYDLRMEPSVNWFENWFDSPLQTKYYTEFDSVDQRYLQKKAGTASEVKACDISRKGECSVCAE